MLKHLVWGVIYVALTACVTLGVLESEIAYWTAYVLAVAIHLVVVFYFHAGKDVFIAWILIVVLGLVVHWAAGEYFGMSMRYTPYKLY